MSITGVAPAHEKAAYNAFRCAVHIHCCLMYGLTVFRVHLYQLTTDAVSHTSHSQAPMVDVGVIHTELRDQIGGVDTEMFMFYRIPAGCQWCSLSVAT